MNDGMRVRDLNELAPTLNELHQSLKALASDQRSLTIQSPPRTFTSSQLDHFERHAQIILEARRTRYVINGLKRMANQSNVSSSAGSAGGAHHVRLIVESSEMRRPRTPRSRSAAETGPSALPTDEFEQTGMGLISEITIPPGGYASPDAIEALLRTNFADAVVECSALQAIFGSLGQASWSLKVINDRGLHVRILNEEIDTRRKRDAAFSDHVYLVAQFERSLNQNTGTNNQRMAASAGRPSGPRPRLSDDDNHVINKLYEEGRLTVREIAAQFGVSRGTVYRTLGFTDQDAGSRTRRSPAVPRGGVYRSAVTRSWSEDE